MHNFYSVKDVQSVPDLVQAAISLKNNTSDSQVGAGKTAVLLFFNPSLRTRLSTQKAAQSLGMHVITLNASEAWKWEMTPNAIMNADKAEHIIDAAKVISQYADVIGIRAFASLENAAKDYEDQLLQTFIQYAEVPVVNLESSILHPCQSLADLITIAEHQTKSKNKIVVSWAPHPKALPQAVTNSFLEWITHTTDNEVTITHPPGYELAERFTAGCKIQHDQAKAFEEADFVYVKNWSSYKDYGKVLSTAPSWTIDQQLMDRTNQAKIMHCLPIRRNVIITDEVLDGPQSLVYKQAENRTHAAKVVLKQLLANG